MNKKFFALSFLVVAGLFSFSGCKEQELPDGMSDLIPYQIKVIQNGEPLADARVILEGDHNKWPIDGVTDSSGVATLRTQVKYKGVPADNYKIAVTKLIETPSQYPYTDAPSEEDDPQGWAAWQKKLAAEYRPTHSYVKKKFGDTKTSGLTVLINAPGSTDIDVEEPVDDLIIPPGTAAKP